MTLSEPVTARSADGTVGCVAIRVFRQFHAHIYHFAHHYRSPLQSNYMHPIYTAISCGLELVSHTHLTIQIKTRRRQRRHCGRPEREEDCPTNKISSGSDKTVALTESLGINTSWRDFACKVCAPVIASTRLVVAQLVYYNNTVMAISKWNGEQVILEKYRLARTSIHTLFIVRTRVETEFRHCGTRD